MESRHVSVMVLVVAAYITGCDSDVYNSRYSFIFITLAFK
jgi:hypothetical protein